MCSCLTFTSRLRPDKFAAAAFASVVTAHSSVDAAILCNPNGFDVAAAVAGSRVSRTIVVLQQDHADSIGDIFAYSEKELGYGPLYLSSLSPPSPELISECARAQRVGGWVVVQVMESTKFRDVCWIADLIPVDTGSSEDSRRATTHSLFRLWIVSCKSDAIPPNILELAHIIIHESPTRSFAAAAAAAVGTVSSIRDELYSHCTLAQRSSITATALFHALFSFKNSCAASLLPGNYDRNPSVPAMRVQTSHLIGFLRSTAGLNAIMHPSPVSQRGSVRTPNSQSHSLASSPIAVSSAANVKIDTEESLFMQALCGGCGLLSGCQGKVERKRLKSLAESILFSISGGITSANVISSMSLPMPLILAAEAGDMTAVTNSMPFEDSHCPPLGPDVQRVLDLQRSCRLFADIINISARRLGTALVQDKHIEFSQLTERFMACVEHGAPYRPSTLEDFLLHESETQGDAQSESEAAARVKNATVQLEMAESEWKSKPHVFPILNPTRPVVNSVFLSLHEVLSALPEYIGSDVVEIYLFLCYSSHARRRFTECFACLE